MVNTDGMTVQELINELSQYDKNAKVHFAYQSGDYWRTVIATPITKSDIRDVTYSERLEDFILAKLDSEVVSSDYVVVLE